jgi:hypothetical protein
MPAGPCLNLLSWEKLGLFFYIHFIHLSQVFDVFFVATSPLCFFYKAITHLIVSFEPSPLEYFDKVA